MNTVFILCAGPAKDTFPKPKQLLYVDGETLLSRAIRLAYTYTEWVDVVTDNPEFERMYIAGFMYTKRFCGTCDTILDTQPFWRNNERVTFLMGDVFYTEEAMAKIMRTELPIAFFGDGQETFAISIEHSQFGIITDCAQAALESAHGNADMGGKQALWLKLHAAKANPAKVWITDRTQDFDTRADYKAFMRGQSKNRMNTT